MSFVQNYIFYHTHELYALAIAFFVSLLLTRICIPLLPLLGYVDKPGGRHKHKGNIPRGGGIAVIIGFFSGLLYYIIKTQGLTFPVLNLLKLFLVPTLILAIFNLLDDHRSVPAKLKFLIQTIVGFFVWYFLRPNILPVFSEKYHLLFIIGDCCLTTLFVVAVVNAFNLSDGLDGNCTGLFIIPALVLGYLLYTCHVGKIYNLMVFLSIFSAFGFYIFNFHPAKIFLGDVGSTFLGLMISIFELIYWKNNSNSFFTLLVLVLLVGVPFYDTFLAVWRRISKKKLDPKNSGGIMDADSEHLHHRLKDRTGSVTLTVLIIYTMQFVFSSVGLILTLNILDTFTKCAIFVFLFFFMVRQTALIELDNTVRLLEKNKYSFGPLLIGNFFHPVYDLCVFCFSIFIAWYFEVQAFPEIAIYFIAVCIPILILYSAHIYHVRWNQCGINDYGRLLTLIVIGNILAYIVFNVYMKCFSENSGNDFQSLLFARIWLIYSLLNLFLIFFERFCLHYLSAYEMKNIHIRFSQSKDCERVLVYGGGIQCRLLSEYLYSNVNKVSNQFIIGIIDDDAWLKNTQLYGLSVFGSIKDLYDIYWRHPFDSILIAISRELDGDKMKELEDFCIEKNVKLIRYKIFFETLQDKFPAHG